MRVLVVNAGSSSVKLRVLGDGDRTLADRELAAPRSQLEPGALDAALQAGLGEADAADLAAPADNREERLLVHATAG